MTRWGNPRRAGPPPPDPAACRQLGPVRALPPGPGRLPARDRFPPRRGHRRPPKPRQSGWSVNPLPPQGHGRRQPAFPRPLQAAGPGSGVPRVIQQSASTSPATAAAAASGVKWAQSFWLHLGRRHSPGRPAWPEPGPGPGPSRQRAPGTGAFCAARPWDQSSP